VDGRRSMKIPYLRNFIGLPRSMPQFIPTAFRRVNVKGYVKPR
jgi:hypothetical protein